MCLNHISSCTCIGDISNFVSFKYKKRCFYPDTLYLYTNWVEKNIALQGNISRCF